MIVHLNGWPGVGKYTVGHALAEELQARFIQNHHLHDVVFACTGFGDPDRWPLYEKVRSAAYEVLTNRPEGEDFVMTNALCIGAPKEVEAWGHVVELAIARSVPLIPIVLRADADTIAERVVSTNRSAMKLKDADKVREMISAHSLQVPVVSETLELDISRSAVGSSVEKILQHLQKVRKLCQPATEQHLVFQSGSK